MDDDDFNSSDIEMPSTQPNKWGHLGQGIIEKMLAEAMENRIESKMKSKTLANVKGAPSVVAGRARWMNQFKRFMADVLKRRARDVPKGEDIERFMFTIAKYFKGRVSEIDPTNTAASFAMATVGLKWLIDGLKFEYSTFTLTSNERLRIANVMESLVRDKYLTKDPKRQSQWLGAFLACKLSTALFLDALTEGTLSWDVVLSKALSIILTSALMTRAGDITRSRFYFAFECMLFGHIEIKLIISDGVEYLTARVTLYFEKGQKHTISNSRQVQLHALMDNTRNVACPISLLIILAMRIGAVRDTTYNKVLDAARARRDKKVVWTRPELPVLSAIDTHTCQLVLGKPAGVHQINNNVQLAAELAGIANHVVAHDLRRGSARDTANLTASINGIATPLVARALGHSNRTMSAGVTDDYVGSLREDLWKRRLDAEGAGQAEEFGVAIADQPFKRRRVESQEIDTYCDKNGLDATNAKDRREAGRKLRAQNKKMWADQALNEDSAPATPQTALSAWSPSELNQQIHSAETGGTETHQSNNEAAPESKSDDLQSRIDPQILESTPSIDDVNATASDQAPAIVDAMLGDVTVNDSEMAASCNLFGEQTAAAPELLLEPKDFIDYFAQVNTVRSWDRLEKTSCTISGGSRAEPTRFKFKCPNLIYGCLADFVTTQVRDKHLVGCPSTSIEANNVLIEKKAARTFVCTFEGCSSSYANQASLTTHVNNLHNKKPWTPKPCKHGCDPNKLYNNPSSFQKHNLSKHGSYHAQRCQFPACTHEKVYDNKNALIAHMRKEHGLIGVGAYKPYFLQGTTPNQE